MGARPPRAPRRQGLPLRPPGHEIPLEARILAVADAFEAMTADRVYRSAMPRAQAMAELERHSGTQFDPMVVSAFLAAVDAGAGQPAPAATPPRRGRYLASVRRGLVLVLCVVGLLAASVPAAGARSYAPRPGKAFHGGTGGYTERAIRAFARRSGRRPAVYQYFFTPGWRRPGRASMHWQRHLLLKTARQGATGDPASVHRAGWARAVGGHAAWAGARRGRRLPEGPWIVDPPQPPGRLRAPHGGDEQLQQPLLRGHRLGRAARTPPQPARLPQGVAAGGADPARRPGALDQPQAAADAPAAGAHPPEEPAPGEGLADVEPVHRRAAQRGGQLARALLARAAATSTGWAPTCSPTHPTSAG